jgi:hypothetical protein
MLGSEYVRVNLWEEARKLGCEIYEIIYAFSQARDDSTGASPLDQWLVTPNVHRREKDVLERWLRQTTWQEMRVVEGLHEMKSGENFSDLVPWHSEAILDSIFPLTGSGDGKCAYYSGGFRQSRCPFYDVCWSARYYWDDPLSSGFRRRLPNHPGERESLQLINITKKGD